MTTFIQRANLIRNPDTDLSTAQELRIYYPRCTQILAFDASCPRNGASFLRELMNFGWQAVTRGRTIHMTHPAADYIEA